MSEVTFGQCRLDRGLAFQEPVHGGVEIVLIDLTEAKQFAEARCGGGGRQRTGSGELGYGVEDATDQQGEHKVAATIVTGTKADAVEADGARGSGRGGNVAMWRLRMTVKALMLGGNDRAALQHTAQTFDAWAIGQSERLHSVRLRTLPPSR